MRKLIIVSLCFITLTLSPIQPLFSQISKFSLQLNAGLSASDFQGKYVFGAGASYKGEFKKLIKPLAGFCVFYNLSKSVSILSGINYEAKGFRVNNLALEYTDFTDPSKSGTYYYDQKTWNDYLILNALVRLYLGKKIKGFANAGPFFGYSLDEKAKFTNLPTGLTFFDPSDFSNLPILYKRMDWGMTIGAGCNSPVSKKMMLTTEGRYNQGLSNINIQSGANAPSINTSSINIITGILLCF